MCRFLMYQGGRPLPLSECLLAPPHALVHQALAPRELHPNLPSADGWGVAWYDAESAEPGGYHTVVPMWRDQNVRSLAPHLASRHFMAATRVATGASELTITNTQPLVAGPVSFAHNGELRDFEASYLIPLRARIGAEQQSTPRGVTDSAHLFAWLLDQLAELSSLSRAVDALVLAVRGLSAEVGRGATLNLLVSDGLDGIATRYATPGETPPSLYWKRSQGSVFVASEPLDDHDGWIVVPPNVRLTFRDGALSERRDFA